MADETGKSDVLNPYGLNPNSGKPMPWARESLAVSLVPNVTQARLYTCWAPGHEPDWAKPRQPEMRAWDPAEDERRRTAANNLGILFLGPVFGAPAALARMAGAPEPVVESMGQVGLDLAGVAGVPAARGGVIRTRPFPNVPSVSTKGVSRPRYEFGVVIKKQATQLDWNAVVPKKGKYKGEKREDHVRRHNKNDLTKEKHGVFNEDGVKLADEAWQLADKSGLKPDANGQLSVPMGRVVGHEGGSLGTGAPLNSIRISVRPGTNELITAYPE